MPGIRPSELNFNDPIDRVILRLSRSGNMSQTETLLTKEILRLRETIDALKKPTEDPKPKGPTKGRRKSSGASKASVSTD